LEAAVRTAQAHPEKPILGLKSFVPVPIQFDPPLVGGFQKFLADRVNALYMNGFHRSDSISFSKSFLIYEPQLLNSGKKIFAL
jgi:hypothetical protein